MQTLFAVPLIAQAEASVIGSTTVAFGQSEGDVYDGLLGDRTAIYLSDWVTFNLQPS